MFLRCLGGFLVDIWNYLGSRSAFSGVFTHFFGPEGVQKQGASRGPGLPGDSQGIFFHLKTPKNGQKKYLKCPKQVGMDSQDLPGVVLCPSSCHDVEILLFF